MDPPEQKRKYTHVIDLYDLRTRATAGDTDAIDAMEILLKAGGWWGLASFPTRHAATACREPVDAADAAELLRLCKIVAARYAAPDPPPPASAPPAPEAPRKRAVYTTATLWPRDGANR